VARAKKISKGKSASVAGGSGVPFAATAEDRAVVKLMAGFGYAQERIRLLIVRGGEPIGIDTFRKHFNLELTTARGTIDQTMFSGLYRAALRGDRWAIEFWLKHKNWREELGGFRAIIEPDDLQSAEQHADQRQCWRAADQRQLQGHRSGNQARCPGRDDDASPHRSAWTRYAEDGRRR